MDQSAHHKYPPPYNYGMVTRLSSHCATGDRMSVRAEAVWVGGRGSRTCRTLPTNPAILVCRFQLHHCRPYFSSDSQADGMTSNSARAQADPGAKRKRVRTGESKSPRIQASRSRLGTGCLQCRARKVKCDETSGGCNNCRNMLLECEWSHERTSGEL
jgi:hypothetical protein